MNEHEELNREKLQNIWGVEKKIKWYRGFLVVRVTEYMKEWLVYPPTLTQDSFFDYVENNGECRMLGDEAFVDFDLYRDAKTTIDAYLSEVIKQQNEEMRKINEKIFAEWNQWHINLDTLLGEQ